MQCQRRGQITTAPAYGAWCNSVNVNDNEFITVIVVIIIIIVIDTVTYYHMDINSTLVLTVDCPSPWISFGSACYKFDLFPTSIDDAKQSCDVSYYNVFLLLYSVAFLLHCLQCSAVIAMAFLSVCPSVTFQCFVETTEDMIMRSRSISGSKV